MEPRRVLMARLPGLVDSKPASRWQELGSGTDTQGGRPHHPGLRVQGLGPSDACMRGGDCPPPAPELFLSSPGHIHTAELWLAHQTHRRGGGAASGTRPGLCFFWTPAWLAHRKPPGVSGPEWRPVTWGLSPASSRSSDSALSFRGSPCPLLLVDLRSRSVSQRAAQWPVTRVHTCAAATAVSVQGASTRPADSPASPPPRWPWPFPGPPRTSFWLEACTRSHGHTPSMEQLWLSRRSARATALLDGERARSF